MIFNFNSQTTNGANFFFSVVENNPARFGINKKELEKRKQFIRDARLHLADMKAELEAPEVNERLLSMESAPSVKIKYVLKKYIVRE